MILYKYVSLEAGLKILENNCIGFSEPRDLNDPFETAARDHDEHYHYPTLLFKNPEDGTMHKGEYLFTHNYHTTNNWSTNFAVLSLTRTPLNKLMLAHYADDHKGMVIGFDISKIPHFTSKEWAYIPAQYGSVIYAATLPSHSTFKSQPGIHLNNAPSNMESRQRAFLYKDSVWGMEEEVRIVKSLKNYGEFFEVIEFNSRPLYLYKLPVNAIAEVHLGCRAKILPAMNGKHEHWLRLKATLRDYNNCKLFQINVTRNSWEVTCEEVSKSAYDGYWQLHFDRKKLTDV